MLQSCLVSHFIFLCSASSFIQDFHGQDVAYAIQFYVTVASAIVGFVVGFIFQRFLYTFVIMAACCGASFIVSVNIQLSENLAYYHLFVNHLNL